MAQIDALLDHMRNTGVVHATLLGDAPSRLENANGISQGNVVSSATLEDMFLEIAPDAACQTMQDSGIAAFAYNDFDFYVTIEGEKLQFAISPTVAPYVAPAVAPPAPAPTYVSPSESVLPLSDVGGIETAELDDHSLPPETRGFNWGAFLLTWIWAIGNNTWVGLLCLVPCIGIFVQFYLGFKGNELAWRNRRFASVEEFKKVQKAWATAGLVLLGIGIFTLPITGAIMFPVFGRARENARRTTCQTHLRMISYAVMQYAQNHGGQLPTSTSDEQFQRDLHQYLGGYTFFDCPSAPTEGTNDYVYNKSLAGRSMTMLTNLSNVPIVWEKDGAGHYGGRNIAFADGNVKWYKETEAQAWIQLYK